MSGEPAMDPAEGVVLGVSWGADAAACQAALGPLVADAGGDEATRRAQVASPLALVGARWSVALVFEFDALCAVVLQAEAGPDAFAGATLPRLVALAERWFGARPSRRDEGYWQVEAGATRLTVDLLEGTLTFEDTDA